MHGHVCGPRPECSDLRSRRTKKACGVFQVHGSDGGAGLVDVAKSDRTFRSRAIFAADSRQQQQAAEQMQAAGHLESAEKLIRLWQVADGSYNSSMC